MPKSPERTKVSNAPETVSVLSFGNNAVTPKTIWEVSSIFLRARADESAMYRRLLACFGAREAQNSASPGNANGLTRLASSRVSLLSRSARLRALASRARTRFGNPRLRQNAGARAERGAPCSGLASNERRQSVVDLGQARTTNRWRETRCVICAWYI